MYFLFAISMPLGQLWAIIKRTVSLIRCCSLINLFSAVTFYFDCFRLSSFPKYSFDRILGTHFEQQNEQKRLPFSNCVLWDLFSHTLAVPFIDYIFLELTLIFPLKYDNGTESVDFKWICVRRSLLRLLHVMRAITPAHASTRVTDLMLVKTSTHHFYLWLFCESHFMKKLPIDRAENY